MEIEIRDNQTLIRPNSKPQIAFLASSEYEVLYGGAAGGGKSYALVIEPLRHIHHPDFTGIIFRRTFPELEGSILPHTLRVYPLFGGQYNIQSKQWRFPSGANIKLGFMQYENDWTLYAGHEYCYQGYDELTTFAQVQFEMLRPWNRSKAKGILPYRRATSNPGGVGHSWVKKGFVEPCRPIPDGDRIFSELAQVWWQPVLPGPAFALIDKESKSVLSRRFIPARVFDNEDLLLKNPQYVNQLLSLPPFRRKALLEGDWDVFEGQFFSMVNPEIHYIPPDPIFYPPPPSWRTIGGLDYGQQTVLEVLTRDNHQNIVNFLEVYTEYEIPEQRAFDIATKLMEYKLYRLPIYFDITMTIDLRNYVGSKKTPIQTFKDVFRKIMKDKAPVFKQVTKKSTMNQRFRVICNEAIKNGMYYTQNSSGKFIRKPTWFVTRNCPHLIQEIGSFVHDPDSFMGLDFEETKLDNAFDGHKYGYMAIKPPESKIAEVKTEKEWYEYIGRQHVEIETWRDPHSITGIRR